jgi:hypothetical protein
VRTRRLHSIAHVRKVLRKHHADLALPSGSRFEVKTPRPIALLFALIVVPASVLPLSAPAFGAEQDPGRLLDVKAHADVERLTDVTSDPGDKTAENEQATAARELRYLNCLCNRCGPSGGEFTRDPKDDGDAYATQCPNSQPVSVAITTTSAT